MIGPEVMPKDMLFVSYTREGGKTRVRNKVQYVTGTLIVVSYRLVEHKPGEFVCIEDRDTILNPPTTPHVGFHIETFGRELRIAKITQYYNDDGTYIVHAFCERPDA